MQINKAKIVDWLLNGWEHDFTGSSTANQSVEGAVDFLTEDIPSPSKKLRMELEQMINHWVSNEDNERIEISMELNLEKSNQLINDYVSRFVKTKK